MRWSAFVVLAVSLGCSSSEEASSTSGDAPGPVASETPSSDLSLLVLANGTAERIVQGSVAKGATPPSTCTTETVAGCTISICTKAAPTPGTAVDPGKLTVSSPSIGENVEIPVADGYARLIQSGPFADDGEEVHLVGAGSSEVAAFDLKVRVPALFAAKSIGDCTTSTDGLCAVGGAPVVAWTGGSGTIVVTLIENADVSPRTSLTCLFAAAPGKGQIPADAIAKLPRTWSYAVSLSAREAAAVASEGAGLHVGVQPARWTSTKGLPAVKLP